jgi:DNA-binding transcriptional ArsR family regulator
LNWQDVSCEIKLEGEAPADDPQLKLGRLLDLLEENGGPLSVAELVKRSDMPETTVRKGLTKLIEQGKVHLDPDPKHRQRKHYKITPDDGGGTA